jgi:hypothetical protein
VYVGEPSVFVIDRSDTNSAVFVSVELSFSSFGSVTSSGTDTLAVLLKFPVVFDAIFSTNTV